MNGNFRFHCHRLDTSNVFSFISPNHFQHHVFPVTTSLQAHQPNTAPWYAASSTASSTASSLLQTLSTAFHQLTCATDWITYARHRQLLWHLNSGQRIHCGEWVKVGSENRTSEHRMNPICYVLYSVCVCSSAFRQDTDNKKKGLSIKVS